MRRAPVLNNPRRGRGRARAGAQGRSLANLSGALRGVHSRGDIPCIAQTRALAPFAAARAYR